jgi:hypothetical protein
MALFLHPCLGSVNSSSVVVEKHLFLIIAEGKFVYEHFM